MNRLFHFFLLTFWLCSCAGGYHGNHRSSRSQGHQTEYLPESTPLWRELNRPKVDYFTMGSTMEEVASVMGSPTNKLNLGESVIWWYYGSSRVAFRAGNVIGWDNTDGNLQVRRNDDTPGPPMGTQEVQSLVKPQVSAKTREEQQIDAEVSSIFAQEHGDLPPAQQLQNVPGATSADMIIRNATVYNLTVLYSGSNSRQVVIPPSSSQRIQLRTGSYRVAAKVDDPSVIPFAGTDTLYGGAYDTRFYIESGRR